MMRGKSKMPLAIMLMGLVFNTLNAYLIGGWLYGEAPAGMYGPGWLTSPQFIIGTIVFLAGMAINLHSDHVIRTLRKPGDTKHYIPRKGFYKYVTSANYFGELTEWIGYAILTWSPAGALFAAWTFANLGPRAKALTEKEEAKKAAEAKALADAAAADPFVAEILQLIEERKAAKKAKNFAEADRIRDYLASKGVTLIDTAQGTTYKID
jgi:protein-S-isoprenylcysteine O-methyltransferase Ste14